MSTATPSALDARQWARVARDAGIFAKEGLEDQIIFIPSATQLAQVLVAGDVDIAGQHELFRLIVAIRDRRRCGVLMVSHDLRVVALQDRAHPVEVGDQLGPVRRREALRARGRAAGLDVDEAIAPARRDQPLARRVPARNLSREIAEHRIGRHRQRGRREEGVHRRGVAKTEA